MKMSDYISRADVFEIIDKAFSQPMRNGVAIYADICLMLNALPTHANSRSTHERDYISRADAIEAVASITMSIHLSDVICDKLLALPSADAVEVDRTSEWVAVRREEYEDYLAKSAEADGEDLIIKGAKGIQDGLYNIKDGKLFKYKAKGGTVRTYPIVPSADAVSREFYEDAVKANIGLVIKNRELKEQIELSDAVHGEWIKKQVFNPELDKYVPLIECSVCGYEPYFGGSESKFNYCANCGARMENNNDSD